MINYINSHFLYDKGVKFDAEEVHQMIIEALFNHYYKKILRLYNKNDARLSSAMVELIKKHSIIPLHNKKALLASKKKIVYQDYKDELKAVKKRYWEYRELIETKKGADGKLIEFYKEISSFFSQDRLDTSPVTQILLLSGCYEIHVRYKYDDSVIKKLAKLSLDKLEDETKTVEMLLHDLVGIRFVCKYPYQKEWVCRAMFNYFDIPNRDDEHLSYGFFSLNRESGYRALHCDRSWFHPKSFNSFTNTQENAFFMQAQQQFNVEIQIMTTLEAAWSKMEHEVSYNVFNKGVGRPEEIKVLWHSLSKNLNFMQNEFESLKFSTEISLSGMTQRGFTFFLNTLEDKYRDLMIRSDKLIQEDENELIEHEVSRKTFIENADKNYQMIQKELEHLKSENTQAWYILKLQSAFIYYKFAEYANFFSYDEIKDIVSSSILDYKDVIHSDKAHKYDSLFKLNACIRYCRVRQKHGFGLMDRTFEPLTRLDESKEYFLKALEIVISLDEESKKLLIEDGFTYFKIIYNLNVMALETETSPGTKPIDDILKVKIDEFRKKCITEESKKLFFDKLDVSHSTNYHFLLGFVNMLAMYNIILPIDALIMLMKYSADDQVTYIDKFYYELAAYYNRATTTNASSESLEFHKKNALFLLSRIKRYANRFEYEKAHLHFDHIMKKPCLEQEDA